MIELNNWHPMPRYGVAAALVSKGQSNIEYPADRGVLWELAKDVLPQLLDYVMLCPHKTDNLEFVVFRPVPSGELNPGKASGQTSANGFYIAPHVLSSQNAADIVKEVKGIYATLMKEDKESNYELKKSFAPMIAKINAGKKSMSNPKIDVLKAAFTAIATLTKLKAAAFIKDTSDNFGNAGILPDLPFFDAESSSYPLIEFIELVDEIMSQGLGDDAFTSKMDKNSYNRPKVFYGNYPHAPRTFGLGSLSLVAAIGKWVEEHNNLYGKASAVLDWLSGRPIYIVSYLGTQQERFGHHLIDLALSGDLYQIIQMTSRVELIGIPSDTKFSNPKWQLFLRSFDHFLRLFDASSWQNFLMHRATYPIEFFHLFKTYFMKTGKYTDELIESAVAYGRSLNRAAYLAGKENAGESASIKAVTEAKQKVMLQLESIIQSAETNQELVARLNAQVGRLTFQDIDSKASLFLKEVVNGKIGLEESQHLITAFMRLSSYDPNEQKGNKLEVEENQTA
ncbi:MAG: hypothetical protein CMN32_14000 [Saprospirales bacterium]|nr:hypothetical protein [Saprospirales bacterium]